MPIDDRAVGADLGLPFGLRAIGARWRTVLQVEAQAVDGKVAETCGFEGLLKLLVENILRRMDMEMCGGKAFGTHGHLRGDWDFGWSVHPWCGLCARYVCGSIYFDRRQVLDDIFLSIARYRIAKVIVMSES